MKNPPAFQFYPQDFISDINVQSMTMEERGAYIMLLCHCWIEDGIPNDSRVVQGWLDNGSTVAKCFYEKDGVYRHSRLDEERQKQIVWREKSRKGGLQSADNKKNVKGGSRVVQPKVNSSSSSSLSSLQSSKSMKNNKNYSSCPRMFSDVDIRLTQLLMDLMLKNNPESKAKDMTEAGQAKWLNECRLLRERDGKNEIDIEKIIRFCQGDSFWKGNILSMGKLREKWDQLWMKATAIPSGPAGRTQKNFVAIRDWLDSTKKEEQDGKE